MARRWTRSEEEFYRNQLYELYVVQNKTIFEVGVITGLKYQTVFDRLRRLDIPTHPEKKLHYLHRRSDIRIPNIYSNELSEFFGIMLGDGHVSPSQISITLGTKELSYAIYVAHLIKDIFGPAPKILVTKRNHKVVYLGSIDIVSWLKKEGLVSHKVKAQVDIPQWIFSQKSYMNRFLRGFFDTDGSVYKLKHGIQMALTNASVPMLTSLQRLCITLGYRVSAISGIRFYLTRIEDIERFFREVEPRNEKHTKRFAEFITSYYMLRR